MIPNDQGTLWWAAKEMQPGKKLSDFVGTNEKTKIVVKLQKRGTGPPGREAVVTEEQKKQMMLQAYRRQEELKVFFKNRNFSFIIVHFKSQLFLPCF